MDLSEQELSELKDYLSSIKDDMDEEKYNFIKNKIGEYFINIGLDKSPILKGETFEYDFNPLFSENSLMFILNKHKNFCKISSVVKDDMSGKYPKTFFLNLIKSKTISSSKLKISLIDNISEIFNLEEIESQFKYCIENGIDIIALPIRIIKHANALIYRVHKNTFEHFEPYGFIPGNEKITLLLKQFINYLTKNKIIKPGVIFIDSSITCPTLIEGSISSYIENKKLGRKIAGLQSMEAHYTFDYNKKIDTTKEISIPEGLCQIWSIFYLDLCLTFPYIDGDILISFFVNNIIQNVVERYDDIEFSRVQEENDLLKLETINEESKKWVANFIYGYFIYLKDNISPDYDEYDIDDYNESERLTNAWSLKLRDSFTLDSLMRKPIDKDFMCFNILNTRPDLVFKFLYKSIDKNHIILNIIERDETNKIPKYKNKTPIVCSSRDYNKPILINDILYFNLIERENIFINKSQMDIIKNKDYTFYQLTEEKSQKSSKYKTFYITKIFTIEDFSNF